MTRPRVTRAAARRIVDVPKPPSPEALEACAQFGVELRVRPPSTPPSLRVAARTLARDLRPGTLALIVGPSGSGKSTILRLLAQAHPCAVTPRTPRPNIAPIDALRGDLHARLRHLTAAGLADATLLARPATLLSDGQRWRLALAVALAKSAEKPTLLAIDEFAAPLDAATARSVAALLARSIRTQRARSAALATTRTDLTSALSPDITVTCTLDAAPSIKTSSKPSRETNQP